MIITIDGPGGSGKSTIAQAVAQKLGYFYLNSGFLYRALAFALVHAYGYTKDTLLQVTHEDATKALGDILYIYDASGVHVWFCDKEITLQLKTVEVTSAASVLGTLLHVREAIVPYEQHLAQRHSLVAEGRDMGSAVYPYAQYKFYVTAELSIRAHRIYTDLLAQGKNITEQEVVHLVQQRDEQDMNRAYAPLIIPADAHVIDTSKGKVQQHVDDIVSIIAQ